MQAYSKNKKRYWDLEGVPERYSEPEEDELPPEVTISFSTLNEKHYDAIMKAENYLLKAGIIFDTGYNTVFKERDWFIGEDYCPSLED